MAGALTGPFAVAALVLCVAGVAKLRAPGGVVRALAAAGAGVPVPVWGVRAGAVFEVAVGGWAVLEPSRGGTAVMAGTYCAFAVVASWLARRRTDCGCFGAASVPASMIHVALCVASAAAALAAVVALPHGAVWMVRRDLAQAVITWAGAAAAAYATVLAYTVLPRAWSAWSPR